MRKLIFKRKKTFTASAAKVRVFIQDSQGELELGGIKCKEIGTLKNGETREYNIPSERVYAFIVFSKFDPVKYHAYYEIPAGNETVELFTGPTLNPVKGNPFSIFDKKDMVELSKEKGW
ncbi:MAG: hypothetical protein FWC52_04260 [Candidatus Methanoplasma sp.]|nr:hypothetical protein [Candidatus Methanoplasma sp.]